MKPLSTAWRWSVRHSPIMGLARGVGGRLNRDRVARRLIDSAELPEPIRERVGAIVRRTRLHASEQGDVARELIAHAQDALRAGGREEELLASLGNPPTVARLIRRAVKRRRPLAYQIRRWTLRAAALSLVLAILAYTALLVRFRSGAPSIRTDYYAQINAPLRELGDEDKAWPAYRDALIEWAQIRERLVASSRVDPDDPDPEFRYPGADHIYDVPRDHPDYDATVEAFRAFRTTLDRAAHAALRPSLGLPCSDRTREIKIEGASSWISEPIEPSANPSEQSGLFMTLLPQLGHSRTIARLFAFDIQIALDKGDADRIERDIRALLGLASQLRREPMLISSLVGMAVHNLALSRLALVIHTNPDLLSAEQLRSLSHAIAGSKDTVLTLNLETERLAFYDMLQRSFTDNGRGGGRLTPEGVRLISESLEAPLDFGAVPDVDTPWLIRKADDAALPILGAITPDRAKIATLYDEIIDAARRTLDAGPDAIATELIPARERLERLANHRVGWSPLTELIPLLQSSVSQVFLSRAATDQTLALLAAAAFRKDHAAWPESLDQLVPMYLPSIPPDPFDGATLKYRLDPSGPIFWYAGADLDDDQGRAPAPSARVRSLRKRADPNAPAPDADWVLFPPQD